MCRAGTPENIAATGTYCTVGRFSTPAIKKYLLVTDRAMSQWFLGGFSNLGDWDSEKNITQPGCQGPWLFSPPVLRCQWVGAGCITFQNCLQPHHPGPS